MASQLRYRSGVVNYLALPVAPGYPIEVGDLVYYNGTYAYAAQYASTITVLASYFAGVAVQKVGLQPGETSFKLTTDPGWILVATSGDFEFDCATGISWKPGSLVCGVALAYASVSTLWATATAYAAGQLAYDSNDSNKIYQCLTAHTSTGTYLTDESTYWRQIYLHNQKVALATTNNYATAIGVAKVPYNALGKTTLTAMTVSLKSTILHAETMSGQ